MSKRRVQGGRYYGLAPDGLHHIAPPAGTAPDVVVARRVADFPRQQVPTGGTVVPCAACAAPVVTNLEKFPTVPRRCMQCSGITPNPIGDPA